MPTTYLDQFYVIDPYAPPSSGTQLDVQKYELVDSDNDGDIGSSGDDTINGLDITSVYQSDTVTVQLQDGSTTTITGTTFYLSDGSVVFTPNDGSTLEDATFVSSTYSPYQEDMLVTDLGPPCFTAGTNIQTPDGPKLIEHIEKAHLVVGYEGKALNLRTILSKSFCKRDLDLNHKLYPVRIVAGALGNGLPSRDLLVSRQHRILLNSPLVCRLFKSPEVLVPAIKLVQLPGIFVDKTVERVTYFHLVFDTHEIVFSEGAATESLFTGPEALESVPADAREELLTIFPELARRQNPMDPFCDILDGKQQRAIFRKYSEKSDRQVELQRP